MAIAAQQGAAAPVTDLQATLNGNWVGVLEYRDYREPATSTKRVTLPTWLTISNGASVWHYTYDDGPNKLVTEDDTVTLDAAAQTWSESANGKPAQVYKVTGLNDLRNGSGTITLVTAGTDNARPAELRMTLTVGRNLVEILEEVRPSGSQELFTFRHVYRLVRAAPLPAGSH